MRKRAAKDLHVGPLIIRGLRIVEPLTGCTVAHGFQTCMHAADAAKEMNEVADWLGVIKTIADGKRPNCQDELARIAESYGGRLAGRGSSASRAACAHAAEMAEAANKKATGANPVAFPSRSDQERD